ncbi:MAG: hypothetical protein NXI16_07040 [Alphaproteobacteria bacterium]|nr:hypothetical protein [Alphaproteobacteria bacterium]
MHTRPTLPISGLVLTLLAVAFLGGPASAAPKTQAESLGAGALTFPGTPGTVEVTCWQDGEEILRERVDNGTVSATDALSGNRISLADAGGARRTVTILSIGDATCRVLNQGS